MAEKMVNFIDRGKALTFDGSGYAINPQGENAWGASAWRDLLLTVVGTGNVIVLGSTQELPPDFSAPSTITNSYTEIALADVSLATSQILAGSAGVSVAGATKIVEANTNLLTWIAIVRDGAGVDVLLTITNAQ